MNKTVSINLGGLFFHIDEDAYQKLNRYFDAIRRSLSPDGKDEIMNDIEGRIAELLGEKLKNDKQVVSVREVEEVIAVMGQPEDYRIDDEEAKASSNKSYYAPGYVPMSKKFYRDGDRGMIAGVCAGIAHYFRIDPLWIRILFIISPFISFGSSILVYVLLWILIPKAITTTEKLEMTGEPINISNIEKKVKEEINTLSDKIQNVDYGKIGSTARTGAERVGNTIGEIFSTLFKAIAKVVAALIVVTTSLGLCTGAIMLIFVIFSSGMPNAAWYPYMQIFNYTDTPLWLSGLLIFFAAGIPIAFLFLLGLKILVNNLRPVSNIVSYTFLAIWIISIGSLMYIGMWQATEISSESKVTTKEEIAITLEDTLNVKFRFNDYYAKNVDYRYDFKFTQDSVGNDIIYSNEIGFQVLKTDAALPYVMVEKYASGNSISEARNRAEKIKYNFEIKGNNLILDNYFVTDVKAKYRRQKVIIYLYLPEGIVIKPDTSVQIYDETGNDFFDLWFDSDKYVYKMGKNRVDCLNCEPETAPHIDDVDPTHVDGDVHISNDEMDIQMKIKNDSVKIHAKGKTN